MRLVFLLVKVYSVYMTKQIYKKVGKNLVITISMSAYRSNPYDDEVHDRMDAIIGLYENEWDNGLCYRIDMDYKGKPDQWSDFFFKLNGTKEEFIAMCNELDIDFVIDESPSTE